MASVYWDNSTKGVNKNLTHTRYHNCWRAEATVFGKRYRKRFQSYNDAVNWCSNLKYEVEATHQAIVHNQIPKEIQENIEKMEKLKRIIKRKDK